MLKRLAFVFFLLISLFAQSKAATSLKYAGKYFGTYQLDSCKISISLNLKTDGTYDLNIKMINTNTNSNYHSDFYLIPLQTQGKWFVKKGILFMAMKSNDTFCDDGQTEYERNYILQQKFKPSKNKFNRLANKYSSKYVKTKCQGFAQLHMESYTSYQFSRVYNQKLALELRIFADFYEQIWTGENTFVVKE